MALANVSLQVYGQLGDLFEKIMNGQAPAKFTNQHLKDIGFNSTNHRGFIPLLKSLGFLSDDGSPTERYREFRNRALSKKILGKAIKEAYSDIFIISKAPSDKDKELIEGKFKSTHNVGERPAELMTKTFFALLEHSDLSDENTTETIPKAQSEQSVDIPIKEKMKAVNTNLHYDIQIHLPATKDIEVYNSIFKSLKEHLID
jgi:hypothetical protein